MGFYMIIKVWLFSFQKRFTEQKNDSRTKFGLPDSILVSFSSQKRSPYYHSVLSTPTHTIRNGRVISDIWRNIVLFNLLFNSLTFCFGHPTLVGETYVFDSVS